MLTHWDTLLGAVEVRTPDAAMDTMLNRWLLYQTLVLPHLGAFGFLSIGRRVWFSRSVAGRDGAGLQQSGHRPRTNSAGRAVISSKKATCNTGGIRRVAAACARVSPTICCGCRLSLRFYANVTGDFSVLDEVVPFLEQPLLKPDEQEVYMQPQCRRSRLRFLNTACARSIAVWQLARTVCR